MKINQNNFRIHIFLSITLILLLSGISQSFAYDLTVDLKNKIVKPSVSNKFKSTHKISFIYTCDQGEIKSLSLRVNQLNVKGGGIDKTLNSSPIHPDKMLLLLPDGGYLGSATAHVKTKYGLVFVEGQVAFLVNGKDQTFSIKLKPFEGMA